MYRGDEVKLVRGPYYQDTMCHPASLLRYMFFSFFPFDHGFGTLVSILHYLKTFPTRCMYPHSAVPELWVMRIDNIKHSHIL